MSGKMPFDFEIPVDFFEKSDEEPGKQRRIGGLASLETKDKQDETLLQRGLDFTDFLHNGWFNDNHSKTTSDILGYPETTQYIRKGTVLPNGQKSKADGHWVEGYLLNTEKADKIWELGKALQKTKRRLGFSVEGKILKRSGDSNKTIAQAKVRNVAITNCPVNPDATMEILAKSLQAVEQSEPDDLEKMLSMGPATPGQSPEGTQTGEGAGKVLAEESLEEDEKPSDVLRKKKKNTKKSLGSEEITAWFKSKLPHATATQIERVVELTHALKRSGQL